MVGLIKFALINAINSILYLRTGVVLAMAGEVTLFAVVIVVVAEEAGTFVVIAVVIEVAAVVNDTLSPDKFAGVIFSGLISVPNFLFKIYQWNNIELNVIKHFKTDCVKGMYKVNYCKLYLDYEILSNISLKRSRV